MIVSRERWCANSWDREGVDIRKHSRDHNQPVVSSTSKSGQQQIARHELTGRPLDDDRLDGRFSSRRKRLGSSRAPVEVDLAARLFDVCHGHDGEHARRLSAGERSGQRHIRQHHRQSGRACAKFRARSLSRSW